MSSVFASKAFRAGVVWLVVAMPFARAIDHSHAGLTDLLRSVVSAGAVDYRALRTEPAALDRYLDRLAAVTAGEFDGWAASDQLAFLINLYNAATLRLIVDHYPVKSIRSIGLLPGSAWKRDVVRLFGRKVSLDHVEHEIIRKQYPDARVHFALVCAAKGCPSLRAEAYVGSRLNDQLDEQGRGFIGTREKNRVDVAARTLHLSPIFKWFAGDFEAAAGSVPAFVAAFLPDELRPAVRAGGFTISYTEYDWSLNERSRP